MELAFDRCALIGMVHLLPLPGSPRFGRGGSHEVRRMLDRAARDAEALLSGGCDALCVENMHDVPYLRGLVAPETVAAMTLGAATVARFGAPFGVQVLAAANREALAIAVATGASFIRAEAFAYAHVADEGWIDASAGPLLRARAALCDPPDAIQIFADVQKKHAAHAVTADLTLADLARGTAFAGADAVIVTGHHTGSPVTVDDVVAARVAGLPLLIGSGVDADNALELSHLAEGLIVGTAFKADGDWRQPVDPERVAALARALGRTP